MNDQNHRTFLKRAKESMFVLLDYIEFFVAMTIVIAIAITIVRGLPGQFIALNHEGSEKLISFLEYILNIIISIEFIFLLIHQTVDAIVEILSLEITRELILKPMVMHELLFGVCAIAVLFAVKKYLVVSRAKATVSLNTERDLIEEAKEEAAENRHKQDKLYEGQSVDFET